MREINFLKLPSMNETRHKVDNQLDFFFSQRKENHSEWNKLGHLKMEKHLNFFPKQFYIIILFLSSHCFLSNLSSFWKVIMIAQINLFSSLGTNSITINNKSKDYLYRISFRIFESSQILLQIRVFDIYNSNGIHFTPPVLLATLQKVHNFLVLFWRHFQIQD